MNTAFFIGSFWHVTCDWLQLSPPTALFLSNCFPVSGSYLHLQRGYLVQREVAAALLFSFSLFKQMRQNCSDKLERKKEKNRIKSI